MSHFSNGKLEAWKYNIILFNYLKHFSNFSTWLTYYNQQIKYLRTNCVFKEIFLNLRYIFKFIINLNFVSYLLLTLLMQKI